MDGFVDQKSGVIAFVLELILLIMNACCKIELQALENYLVFLMLLQILAS